MQIEFDVTSFKVPSYQRTVMSSSVNKLVHIVICNTHNVIKMPKIIDFD